jgi:hypothetical protein
VEFFAKNNATRGPGDAVGGKATMPYDLRLGASKLTLWTDASSEKPPRISRTKDMQTIMFDYLSYEDTLAFDPALFRPPSGVKIEETK